MNSGASKLKQIISRIAPGNSSAARTRSAPFKHFVADCQQPDAPPDLPITHGLMLAGIEARLTSLERQVTNQNRLLLIGVIALVGELAKQVLTP